MVCMGEPRTRTMATERQEGEHEEDLPSTRVHPWVVVGDVGIRVDYRLFNGEDEG